MAASGTGHVMRCCALAEEFSWRGWEVAWQGEIGVPWLSEALLGAEWTVESPQGTPDAQARSIDADVVVVDSYALPTSFREVLLERKIPVVVIADDHHRTLGPGSLWVNPGAPVEQPPRKDFLNGPEFVLIRQEIRDLRALRLLGVRSNDVTFLLGGTDFGGLAPVINELDLDFDIWAGPGVSTGSAVHWLSGGPDLLRRAATSRLVVSAAGVSSWEMLHIGVPLALIATADNQEGNYRWMSQQGWARALGTAQALSRDATLLRAVLSVLEALEEQDGPQDPPVDGLGAIRVVDAVEAQI
jgi:spore coat polysaccharide biosynthesis predicted glycosyltransferase SpsG